MRGLGDGESRPIVLHLRDNEKLYAQNARTPNPDVDYFGRYLRVEEHLNENVHPHVNTGAGAIDGILLTDHGPNHIATVIQRIGDLSNKDEKWTISPYEAYLLMVGAHFHDLGNAYGRQGHEKKAREVLFGMESSLIGSDNLEKRLIGDIAMVHGGKTPDHNKDTIGELQQTSEIKKLAAILRLADELSDDHTRTGEAFAKIMEAEEKLLKASQIFHVYAGRLKRVQVDHHEKCIRLRFELLREHLQNKYWKEGNQTYLLDEIFKRTLKTFLELKYCSRFLIPSIVLERVEITLAVCSEKFENVDGIIRYVIEERGYPESPQHIAALAPDLQGLSGSVVARKILSIPESEGDSFSSPLDLVSVWNSENT